MAQKLLSKKSIKQKTIKDMKGLKIYKPEYNTIIDVYVDIQDQYQRALAEFERGGYQYETETAAGGSKKSAIVATLENLRKDLVIYSDRLCLNHKAIETVTTETGNKSKLAMVLSELKRDET